MKRPVQFFLLLFFLFQGVHSFGQDFYELRWNEIQKNYSGGTFKSNLPLIMEIQEKALKDKNFIELVKSLKAEYAVVSATQDDERNDGFTQFYKKLINVEGKLKGQEKLIFSALRPMFVRDYYDDNRWEIADRTDMEDQDSQEMETWASGDFRKFLGNEFQRLGQQNFSQIKLEPYRVLFKNTDDLEYFPTLAEWLVLQEIEFWSDDDLFTPDELKENRPKVEVLYERTINRLKGNPRLYFEYLKINDDVEYEGGEESKKLELFKRLADDPQGGDFRLRLIEEISNLLVDEHPEEAMAWLKKGQKIFPKSEFQNNLQNKINDIIREEVTINYDLYTLPNEPIHLAVKHRNATSVGLTIYKVKDIKDVVSYLYDEDFSSIKNKLQPIRENRFQLKDDGKYKSELSSVKLPGLPAGLYIVRYETGKDEFSDFWFSVTDQRLIYSEIPAFSGDNVWRLVRRSDGRILGERTLDVINFSESYAKPIYGIVSSAPDGRLTLPQSTKVTYSQRMLIQDTQTGEVIYQNFYKPSKFSTKPDKPRLQSTILLDRAIYRPGQTVYFKVINVSGNEQSAVVADRLDQLITLRDAQNQVVAQQQFRTNEFGSYHGSFILPKGLLNGMFQLWTDIGGSKYFRVEEYKRPTFEVTFEPLEGAYKLGEQVKVKGKVVSFSGVPLADATVNYDIKKEDLRYRYFYWIPRSYAQNSILGTVQTDEQGYFEIPLDLKKEEDLKGIQVNGYSVEAVVIDINGETQQNTTRLTAASVSHYLDLSFKEDSFSDEELEATVTPKNYNGQTLDKSYRLRLSKLNGDKKVYRNNFEEYIQSQPWMAQKDFEEAFPHDYFSKEERAENRKVVRDLFFKEEKENKVKFGRLSAGFYELEAFNIEGQDTIRNTKRFQVFDKKSVGEEAKPFFTMKVEKDRYKPGETAKVYLYSAIPEAQVYLFKQPGDGSVAQDIETIKNGVAVYEVPIPVNFKKGVINLQAVLPAYNDMVYQNVSVAVEQDSQPMKIEMTTFRDKMQPGAKETWTAKVTGKDGTQPISEVLAAMYDQSLDQFASNSFYLPSRVRTPYYQMSYRLDGFDIRNISFREKWTVQMEKYIKQPSYSWMDRKYFTRIGSTGNKAIAYAMAPPPVSMPKMDVAPDSANASDIQEVVVSAYGIKRRDKEPEEVHEDTGSDYPEVDRSLLGVQVRENLNETAFFYPNLLTDKKGNVSFEFTSPEALTRWKLMLLAHDKKANSATLTQTAVTQKDFSVTPNYPRFLREGDRILLQSKLASLSDEALTGKVRLELLDAFTMENIGDKFGLQNADQSFELVARGTGAITWELKTPDDLSGVVIKVVAAAGKFSDGEQKAVPVLPNRMLVTDAVPVFVKEGETKTFVLENLQQNKSKTLSNFSNTLELKTNPIWEVIFALPALKRDANQSADVVFNRWFGDVLASEIYRQNPRLKAVFEEYRDKGLLESNLEKNQELKQLLLEETPWVLDAQDEKEQMLRISRLFEVNQMQQSMQEDWQELKKLQNPDGGFAWIPGYPSSYSTSLYILRNLGKLKELLPADHQETLADSDAIVAQLVKYVDRELARYWDKTKDKKPWTNLVLDYLNTRNYWETKYPLSGIGLELKGEVKAKAQTAEITDFTFYGLSRMALLMKAYGLPEVSQKLATYLEETSTDTKTQGVYWKQNLSDWGWYASKTANQALTIQALERLMPGDPIIEEAKIWLVTQKQVSHWGTSRSTAEVIYTILTSGKSWTSPEAEEVKVVWGGKELKKAQTQATGYLKEQKTETKIDSKLATVTVSKPGPGIVQGGLFWQYYEDIDQIKSSENYLSLTRELYKKEKTVNGEILKKITEDTPLKVGDRVTVRMILNTDRPMEFVHLKDMRAAGLEPTETLSGYRFRNNLGYYQSTKDASMNFYIQYMPKGKYVFEYDYIANAAGSFSNGIATLQNYYAPEMNAHSAGMELEIKP